MIDDLTLDQGWDIVRRSGLSFERLVDMPGVWDEVLAKCDYVPVSYIQSMVLYQSAYMANAFDRYLDLSMIVYWDNVPVGCWPLNTRRTGESWVCGSNATAVNSPLFMEDLPEKTRKSILNGCFATVESLCRKTGQDIWRSEGSVRESGVDLWHRNVMERGGEVRVTHELFVDMSQSVDSIRSGFRKSYKPLISKGSRLWQCRVLAQECGEAFQEYRELHRRVAGRVTRSPETWALQESTIATGDAFLVELRDDGRRMVGGGLFYTSGTEGLYAIGVYDRNLFDQPLGHLVQMRAIEHMKELGLRWYKLGARPYLTDEPVPTEKEVAIGHFKEGFATNFFLKVHAVCTVPSSD